MAKAVSIALAALGLACALLVPRAARRDTAWLRARQPGPLDFVPIRTKAKRIHLGLRLTASAVLLVAAAIVAVGAWG